MPDVNCMLTMSSLWSSSSGTTVSSFLELDARRSLKDEVARKEEVSIRFSELFTRMIFRNEGTEVDSSFEVDRSDDMVFSNVIFSLGGLYGRFVSVPITKCAASR